MQEITAKETRQEVIAIVQRERVRRETWTVLDCWVPPEFNMDRGKNISVICHSAEGEITPNLSYRFFGKPGKYKNKTTGKTEEQFTATTFVHAVPHGRSGIVTYLQKIGKGMGLGPTRAGALYDTFRGEAVRVLRADPLAALSALQSSGLSISLEKINKISEKLKEVESLEGCTIDLMEVLEKRGFPKSLTPKLIKKYGNNAPLFLKRNPFLLLQFPGCGIKRVDAMYLQLGLPPASLKRQAIHAIHAIATESNVRFIGRGSTWQPISNAVRGITANVGGTETNPPKALKLAKRAKKLSTCRTDQDGIFVERGGAIWIAEKTKADQEGELAKMIAGKVTEHPIWPRLAALQSSSLTPHQLAAVKNATRSSLGILCGGPGTGKTFTTAKIIKHVANIFGEDGVAVCAPTNKAAHRLTMGLQNNGVSLLAKSIHRTLGVQKTQDGWQFIHNKNNKLPCKVLVIDEGSMIATNLMLSVFSAVSHGTMILIVGDPNQLPPIEHGRPMFDMIESGKIPIGKLEEPQRNAGTIVFACNDICNGKRFRADKKINIKEVPPRNFKILEAQTPTQQLEKITATIRVAKNIGFDPIWDCQVMVAVNETGLVNRVEINRFLQDQLNPNGKTAKGNLLRAGDKIVCIKNGWSPSLADTTARTNSDNECFVANGEFGRVIAAEEKNVDIAFEWPARKIRFYLGKKNNKSNPNDTRCAVERAYGCTVHKMQGSEAAIGIPIIDESNGAKMICTREWWFTAISRGKVLSLPIGQRKTADKFCKNVAIKKRKTFLKELIIQELKGY